MFTRWKIIANIPVKWVKSLWLNRQPVKVFKTLTGSPIFFVNFTNWRHPSNPNYHMSIKKCQAIAKSLIDLKSNAWFTLGSEYESIVCDQEFMTLIICLRSTAGQGFQDTKWPAVRYFSWIWWIKGTHPIQTIICRLWSTKRSWRALKISSLVLGCSLEVRIRSYEFVTPWRFPVQRDACSWREICRTWYVALKTSEGLWCTIDSRFVL